MLVALVLFGVSYLIWDQPIPHPRSVSSLADPPVEQGEVWGPEQDEIAQQILEQTKGIVDQNQGPDKVAHRDAHPKAHGCVKANWSVVESQLEQKLGVFSPGAEPIKAWIRFSNGDPKGFTAPDSTPDIRGFAVKLMTANGPHQDFIAMNSPRFFSRDAEDYFRLFHALMSGKMATLFYFGKNFTNLRIVSKAKAKIDNVLTTSFFTPVPSKLGPHFMRMKFTPCAANFEGQPAVDQNNPNFLRESLVATLRDREACFEVFVQPNNEPKKELYIENPTLEWDEHSSPFIKVARLDILRQEDFDTPERNAFCENLNFNPWHTHPDLRPMGQINRVRRLVYDEISRYRHNKNNRPEIEPNDHDACVGPTAPLCQPFDGEKK